jgi:LPXTG-site transpeptidase (sortase) family protein
VTVLPLVRLLGHVLTAAGLVGLALAGTLYLREDAAQETAWRLGTWLEQSRVLVAGAAGVGRGSPAAVAPQAPASREMLERGGSGNGGDGVAAQTGTAVGNGPRETDRSAAPQAQDAPTQAAAALEAHSAALPVGGAGTPITRVRLERIGLDAEVVQAKLVDVAGGTTWQVPAFRVGHGELSAGAGEEGNAVLLGHVTSVNAGNVFRDLNRARRGDEVWLTGGGLLYRYVVAEVRSVSRSDISVLGPLPGRSVSLITCTGTWLPALNDYAERLVVRAELAEPAATASAGAGGF